MTDANRFPSFPVGEIINTETTIKAIEKLLKYQFNYTKLLECHCRKSEGIRDNSATGGDERQIKAPKVLADNVGLVMGFVYLDCAFDVNAFWVKRELFHDLAPLLCNSFGTSIVFQQEIISIYPFLSPPNLTPAQSNRVCTVLALLQCVASHPDTRMSLLNASIPSYLYAFLVTTSKSRPFEYLRLASLGFIGALVKAGDTEVIRALLSPEIIPSCLRSMDIGCELSKTVATFILQKILLDDAGLDYICTRAVRFFDVAQALGNMVGELVEQPSSRLMKYIIRCYLRLSDNPRSCDALGSCLPDMLRDTTFSSCLHEDPVTRMWLQELLQKVDGNLDALQAGGSVSRIHSTRI